MRRSEKCSFDLDASANRPRRPICHGSQDQKGNLGGSRSRFVTNADPYRWLTDVLAAYDGTFNEQDGKAIWSFHARDTLIPVQAPRPDIDGLASEPRQSLSDRA